MITFLCGRAGSGKSTAVAARIAEALDAGRQRLILIVPEQQAVVWETRAARLLPPSAPLSLEIVSFRRLCNLVARAYGGLSERPITRGGKAALMWATLRSLADACPHLLPPSPRRLESAVPALLSAVSEMKRAGVSPAALSEAAGRLGEDPECARLGARAGELSLVAAAYASLVAARYDDEEDALAHLAERLKNEPFFAGTDVFVDSFFSLTPVECDILCQIFRQADNVTVSFSCPAADTGEPQWAPVRAFLAAMREGAARAHREVTTVSLEENRRARTPELAFLEANLWRFDAAPREGAADAISSVAVRDRYAEAEAAACRIQSLLRGGARCADIAVLVRDAESRRGILDAALARHRIPFFFSERADAAARPAARLLLGALAVAGGGWRREDVLTCAKTGLCGLTDDECDALETYTDTWHIRGARAFSVHWGMNPDGYVAALSPRAARTLDAANRARETIVPPLAEFAAVFEGGAAPVREIARAAYEFLCAFGVWDALAASAERLDAAGAAQAAAEERQLWDVLMDALDTLVDAVGDDAADPAAFAALWRQVLAEADIGSIPSGVDEVVVGSADSVRLGEIDHVLLLGCVDGEFPGTPADDGFFSDTDKIRLEGEGVTLSARTDLRMAEELLWFYRAAALPRRSLTLFLPRTDGRAPTPPSLAAERVGTLFPAMRREDAAAWDAHDFVFTPADARRRVKLLRGTAAGEALSSLGALPPPAAHPIPLSARDERISPATAELLFGRDVSLTQSRLDSFVLCRFGCHCRYAAGLQEEKEASLAAVNVGTFVHRVFELFFRRVAEEGRELPLPEAEQDALTDEIVAAVVAEITPEAPERGRAAYLFSRLRRCVAPMLSSLSREMGESAFRPAFFELPLGRAAEDGGPAVPPRRIPLGDGRTVSLRGTIDRLDVWQDGGASYVRVVDYKTGRKQFRPGDVSVGVNTQLLLYLFSVLRCPPGPFRERLTGAREGEIRAAGALYVSARPGEVASDTLLGEDEARAAAEASAERSGFVLDDEAVRRAMAPATDAYLPPLSVSAEELETMEGALCETVSRIARELLDGAAEAAPRAVHGQNPCAWCPMHPICRTERNPLKGDD